jgi:hypothetical protein
LFQFDFLMEWSYHLELVVMFHTVYFTWSGFLFSGLSTFLFQCPTLLDVGLQREWDSDNCCVVTNNKRKYKQTQQDVLLQVSITYSLTSFTWKMVNIYNNFFFKLLHFLVRCTNNSQALTLNSPMQHTSYLSCFYLPYMFRLFITICTSKHTRKKHSE